MESDQVSKDIPATKLNDGKTQSENGYAIVNEGDASVLFPASQSVFYNPVQEFNRDLTIAVISTFARLYAEEEAGLADATLLGRSRKRKIRILNQKFAGMENDRKNRVTNVNLLEGLAATGLRSVRFALEIPRWLPPSPAIRLRVTANDYDPVAADLARTNVARNAVEDVMSVECDDVVMLMLNKVREAKRDTKEKKKKRGGRSSDSEEESEGGIKEESVVDLSDRVFQVIDLDPYGTAAPFLDSAVQALCDGGLLCVTCTDAAVLCGQTPETCFTKYGAVSLRAKFCHEQALRILLHCISLHAARHSKYVEPLISLSIDFYVRVFVRIHHGQAQAKEAYTKTATLFNCSGCGTHHLQPMGHIERNGNSVKFQSSPVIAGVGDKCIHCNHRVHIGGPVWVDRIHNLDFVKKVKELVETPETPELRTRDRIIGMLTLVEEELPDVPLYYVMDEGLCGALKCFTPPAVKYRSAFLNAGYRVSLSHAAESSVKTDAPAAFIWDLMRAWVKEVAVNPKRTVEGSVSQRILSVEPETEIDFTRHEDATTPSQVQGLKRFPPNPEANWGPKPRAKRLNVDTESSTNADEAGKPDKAAAAKKRKRDLRKTRSTRPDLKQFACKRFLAGTCERDADDCVYSHDVDAEKSGKKTEENGDAKVASAMGVGS